MDKELLSKELTIAVLTKANRENLEATIKDVLSEYSVTKLETTLPASNSGEISRFLVAEFMKDKIAQGVKPNSLEQYVLGVNKLYIYVRKDVNLVTKDDIVNYLNFYRYDGKEKKPNTVQNRYLQLSNFYTWLFKHKYIAINPFDTLTMPKGNIPTKQIITAGEKERMIITCENTITGIKLARTTALISFLGDTGVRVSECSNVKIEDVDFNNKTVLIRHGKGDKSRIVYFGNATKERLLEYLSYRNYGEDDYLFTHYYRNKKLTVDGIQAVIRVLGRKCNIERIHPHLFRTTLATNLLVSGISPSVVKSILGHSNLQTLESYTSIATTDIQIAFNQVIK